MSDYIKREDAIFVALQQPLYSVVSQIKQLEGIDIVRCKECKHGTYCKEAEMYICNANDQDLYEAEHFCSYGEREGER